VKEEPTVLHIDSDGDGNVDVTWSAPGNSTSTTPDSAPSDDPITSIQPTSITFDNGQTTYFLTLEDGSESVLSVNIAPYNATETNLTWYSSDSNVVTIDPVVAATVRQSAKLAGVGVGTATVIVSTSNGLSATATVTVTPAENPTLTIDLSQLSLQNGTLKLEVGEIVDATIRSNPAGASFKATGLPNGLTLNSTGHLSGSASVAGTYPVRVEATLNGITKTAAFEIEVATVTGSRKPSSGGGCNAGTGSMALTMLAASILAVTKRKGQ
jgi:alpha-amylase